ncbi:hypothetical protein Pst134EA_013815 [Puccinia striiformis f. sp. tritici]|uniref:hypothetical protein n=1 Tax=Puccinia striiformis f. sp. tritici TaxID=168172 RepID=UPI002007E6D9|nr:hypothetical protein Pst134EA_013815 [Puccinia striiformis f. sp. tritici]KAH9465961.1 hypothetical protein Pst134EA_013815 [Puccinia striiformis f. sp. tritici]
MIQLELHVELAISENKTTEVEGGEEEPVLKNSSSSNTRPEEDSQPLLLPRVTQSHSFSASSSSSKATERLPSLSHDVPSDDHDDRVQQNKDVGALEQNDHQLSSSKSYPYSSSPLSPPLSPPPSKTTLQQQIKHQANQIHPHNSSCSTSPSPTALTTTTDTDYPNHLSNTNGTPRQSEKNIASASTILKTDYTYRNFAEWAKGTRAKNIPDPTPSPPGTSLTLPTSPSQGSSSYPVKDGNGSNLGANHKSLATSSTVIFFFLGLIIVPSLGLL